MNIRAAVTIDPADVAERAESLTLGFLVVLERLTPIERAVFLLADDFAEPFATIAAVVDRSENACRQIATWAQRRVGDQRRHAKHASDAGATEHLLGAFLVACAFGQVDELRQVLVDDVVLVSDGGSEVRAARRPVVGADRVSRLLVNLTRRLLATDVLEIHRVNGEPGLVVHSDGKPRLVMALEVDGPRIAAIRIVMSPDKLRALAR